ncbi:MAG: hypothetical protein R2787_10030 [Saprospiraceae bacterium]
MKSGSWNRFAHTIEGPVLFNAHPHSQPASPGSTLRTSAGRLSGRSIARPVGEKPAHRLPDPVVMDGFVLTGSPDPTRAIRQQ